MSEALQDLLKLLFMEPITETDSPSVTRMLSLSHRPTAEVTVEMWNGRKKMEMCLNETFSGGWFAGSLTDGEVWRC